MKLESELNAPEIRFALEVIQSGAKLAQCVRTETELKALTKNDNSPVTVADMGIQAVAGALLQRYLPNTCLVAEENSVLLKKPEAKAQLQAVTSYVSTFLGDTTPEKVCDWIDYGTGVAGDHFWTLDPIDGTKGFVRGGQYVTALALIHQGKVEISALGCPELTLPGNEGLGKGVMLLAARGKGCWAASLKNKKDWVRLHVSSCQDLKQARILDSFDPNHKNNEKNTLIKEMLGIQPEPLPLDSQAKHAMLAAGAAEIFYRTLPRHDPGYREKIWDVAPGAFVIEEAGGCVTDLSGVPIDYKAGNILENNSGFVATNGKFHSEVLKAIKEVTAALSK